MAPDPVVIAAKLATIQEAVAFLGRMAALSHDEFVADRRNYRAAERELQVACEAVLEIGAHVISTLGLPKPERYADILPILAQGALLSRETASSLKDLAGFRNPLVHEYGTVDRRRLHDFMRERLDDFRRFSAEISTSLKLGG